MILKLYYIGDFRNNRGHIRRRYFAIFNINSNIKVYLALDSIFYERGYCDNPQFRVNATKVRCLYFHAELCISDGLDGQLSHH